MFSSSRHSYDTSLLQFLAKQQTKSKLSIDDPDACLTRSMLNVLWDNALSDNQMTANSCVQGIGDASEEFSSEVFQFFNEKIATYPIERSTETWVTMFGEYAQMALVTSSRDIKESSGGSWGLFGGTPSKSKRPSSKINVNVVLDKLFDIVFAPSGVRIEKDAVRAAHSCLLTALKSNGDMRQHYLAQMMSNIENGMHIEACMTMMSGLLPLLSGGRPEESVVSGGSSVTPRKEKKKNNEQEEEEKEKENYERLFRLHNTIVRLVVEATTAARAKRLLDFLCDICTHGNLRLSSETMQTLWQPMTKKGTEYSSELFRWLVRNGDQLISKENESFEKIFKELVLPRMEEPGNEADSIPLFCLFVKMFDEINNNTKDSNTGKNLMKDGKAMTLNLIGMESLWKFLSSDTVGPSLNMCVNKLIMLVLNMHPRAYGGDKKVAWNLFIETSMALMNDHLSTNDDATLQSVLQILSTFLDQVKKQKLPYDPSYPGMLIGARMEVEWKKGHWYSCTVDNFDGHKGMHHATYDDGDVGWYTVYSQAPSNARGHGSCDVWLETKKAGKRARIVSWDSKYVRGMYDAFEDLKRYPMYVLTHNAKFFKILFAMIGSENRTTARDAWRLLTKEGVPTNPEKKTKLALCGSSEDDIQRALDLSRNDSERGVDTLRQGSSASNPLRQRTMTISEIDTIPHDEWDELLGCCSSVGGGGGGSGGSGEGGGSERSMTRGTSPLQLLYSLRIVNKLVFPTTDSDQEETSQTQQSQAAKYGTRFVRSGGFTHMYHLLTEIDIQKFADDKLSKECLVVLLRLFNHFYKLFLDGHEELQSLVVQQIDQYHMDPEYKDLVPRLLQIVHVIARASSLSRKKNNNKKKNIIVVKSSNVVRGSNVVATSAGASKYSNDSSSTVSIAASVLSIEAKTVENATGLLVSFVRKQPKLMDCVYENSFTPEMLLYALIECTDRDVRSELGRGIIKLCAVDDSTPNVFFLKLLLNRGLSRTAGRKLSNNSQEYFLLVDTLMKNSPSLQGVEVSDVAKTLSEAIQSSPIVQTTENDDDPRLEGLMSCLTSLLARDGSSIGEFFFIFLYFFFFFFFSLFLFFLSFSHPLNFSLSFAPLSLLIRNFAEN